MKQDWPFFAAFGLAAMGATGALAYMVSGGAQYVLATAVGLGLVGVGQISLLGLNLQQQDRNTMRLRRALRDTAEMNAEVRNKSDYVLSRLTQFEAAARVQSDAVLGGIAEMKASYGDLRNALASLARPPAPVAEVVVAPEELVDDELQWESPAPEAVTVIEPEPAAADTSLSDLTTFALEPIIDMRSKRTAHYRLHLSLKLGDEEIGGERLLHHVARVGLRPQLDYVAASETLGLLQRLRQRDPDLCILMNVGAETLRDASTVAQILAACEAAGPTAQGLVLEMPHAALSGLSEQALEGLAELARQGMHFALSQVSVSGLDLEAMALLNIRHVGVAAGSIDLDGPSPTLVGFAQLARLSRIDVIVMDVRQAALVPKLRTITRLACGPCFANPRRVKRVGELAHEAAAFDIGLAA
ncbi:MAG: EAL domain-containing protein [Aestuariivirga sp.]